MKSLKFLFPAILTLSVLYSQAQTAAVISDSDLEKYALTMDSVKVMQATLIQIITESVQKNSIMTVARYNELSKVSGDTTKLKAANGTTEEIAFIKEIADLRQYNNARITSAFQFLAKEYVGLKAFNAIKKSLETDATLKARYEGILQKVQVNKNRTGTTKGG